MYLCFLFVTSLLTARNVNCPHDQLITLTEYSSHLDANSSSASQEIHSLLLNPKAHYRVHSSPPPDRNLPQM
jgi:hypothetical protein